MDPRLAPALRELNRLLAAAALDLNTQLRFAVLGDLVVSTWGVIRATEDIDFLADSEPSADVLRQELSPEGIVQEFSHLTLAQVYDALSYYYDHKETIDRRDSGEFESDTET